jgi:hypothetical protein
MIWIADWAPLIVTAVAWVIFFWFLRDFRGERFLRIQEEHAQHLKHHTALLERIVEALEKVGT